MRANVLVRSAVLASAILGAGRAAEATTIATFVDAAFSTTGLPIYDSASVTVFLNPALTSWVAWNNTPTVSFANAGCSAFVGGSGVCLGPGGFGTDDYIALTVTNPLSASLTLNLDQNTPFGNSFGVQNVIFGTAANAPDAIRISPSFGQPPNIVSIFNEAGPFSALFTVAGNYTFAFSFRDNSSGPSGHQSIYLLSEVADTQPASVPEPATIALFGAGLTTLATRFKKGFVG